MKILIAPDKFKDSLSAIEVAKAIKAGIKKALPQAEVILCPLADGGEGTVETIISAEGGRIINKMVTGPVGNKIRTSFGILKNKKPAIIEMAQASGLWRVPEKKRNPLYTTTYGTGELIRRALDEGAGEIIIGIGGSATNDGGMGIARALGAKFFDIKGKEIGLGGKDLKHIFRIDISSLDKRIKSTKFIVASDVFNPLCGPKGASRVYAPQKGATEKMVEELEEGMLNYARVIKKDLGLEVKDIPGAGAAGGTGAGLKVFLEAEIKSGIGVVLEAVKFQEKMKGVDLIITGEGRIDKQSLYGKVIRRVGELAKEKGIPVIALGGQVKREAYQLHQYGIVAIFPIINGPLLLREAMKQAPQFLARTAEEVIRFFMTE